MAGSSWTEAGSGVESVGRGARGRWLALVRGVDRHRSRCNHQRWRRLAPLGSGIRRLLRTHGARRSARRRTGCPAGRRADQPAPRRPQFVSCMRDGFDLARAEGIRVVLDLYSCCYERGPRNSSRTSTSWRWSRSALRAARPATRRTLIGDRDIRSSGCSGCCSTPVPGRLRSQILDRASRKRATPGDRPASSGPARPPAARGVSSEPMSSRDCEAGSPTGAVVDRWSPGDRASVTPSDWPAPWKR